MAKVRTKNKGGSRERNSQGHKRKEKRKAKRLRQRRHYRQMRSVNVGRAARDPKPTPRARGYLATQFWRRFKLGEALEAVGVFKDGLPLGHILLVVMLFGLLNATSLANVVQEVNQDGVLRAILGIEDLEVKQVYRGLARLTVVDYQAWMGVFLQELQKDPRTASRREGVLIGDGTQKQRSHSRKRGRGVRWLRVIYLHGEKRFDYGYEVESTHYAEPGKDYPLLSAIHELSAERAAEIEEARQRQAMGLDLRRSADRVTWLKHLIAQGEDVEWVELGARDLSARMRQEVEALQVDWVGVSGQRRVYHLKGRAKPQPAQTLLKIKCSQKWLDLPDVGYHLL